MGRDLTLYPATATRDELKSYLEDLGFVPCEHWWDWPAGTLNYSWFDEKDYRSIDGVSADIYPLSGEELKQNGNPWALHVRNVYSASWYDVKMLNDVLRGARRKFGGTIRGDYGTNRYATLWKDKSTPISRGVSRVYQHALQQLHSIKFVIPESQYQKAQTGEPKADELIDFMNSMDPTRTLYNALVPFSVAVFEYFFSSLFLVLIKYDPIAREKRHSHNQKIELQTLIQVNNGDLSVERVIASEYSFQNLERMNRAFKDWLRIDIRKVLFKKRRIGKSIAFLESRIEQIIQYRHGIVHRFEIDRAMTKEQCLATFEAVEKSIREVVSFLEGKYDIEIDEY